MDPYDTDLLNFYNIAPDSFSNNDRVTDEPSLGNGGALLYRRRRSQRLRDSVGYSLAELMVVITIMGIVGAIAFFR